MHTTKAERLYHATPTKNAESIREHGLRLSQGCWGQQNDTPRVYLTNDPKILYLVAQQIITLYGVDSMAIVVVDANKCDLGNRYDDPDWYIGKRSIYIGRQIFYVERTVPPDAIAGVLEDYWTPDRFWL